MTRPGSVAWGGVKGEGSEEWGFIRKKVVQGGEQV